MISVKKEIVFVAAPFCPKCVRIKRWLKDIEENQPDIKITRFNIAFDMKKVKKYKIKTIPTLIVGESMMGGWIKEEEFRAALEKIERRN